MFLLGLIIRRLPQRTVERLPTEAREYTYLTLFSLSGEYFLVNDKMKRMLEQVTDDIDRWTVEKEKEVIDELLATHFEKHTPQKEHISKILDFPVKTTILLTYRCNLSCKYCYLSASPQRKEILNYNDFVNFAKLLNKSTVMEVDLSGGEPLTHPHFMGILHFLKDKNKFAVGLATNGTLLTDKIVRKMKEYNLDIIQLSLDSIHPEEHDLLRGRGNFDRVMQSLNMLLDARLPVGLTITLNKINVHQIKEYLKFAEEKGIQGVRIGVLHKWGRANTLHGDVLPRNIVEEYNLLYKAYKAAEKFKDSLSLTMEKFPMNEKPTGCMASISFAIEPNGNIIPCDIFAQTGFSMGSIHEIQDILTFWDTESYRQIRKYFDFNQRPCNSCPYFKYCGSYCTAGVYRIFNQLFPPKEYFDECKNSWKKILESEFTKS